MGLRPRSLKIISSTIQLSEATLQSSESWTFGRMSCDGRMASYHASKRSAGAAALPSNLALVVRVSPRDGCPLADCGHRRPKSNARSRLLANALLDETAQIGG